MQPINESLIIFSLFFSLSSSTLSKELVGVSGDISDNKVKDGGDVDAIDDDNSSNKIQIFPLKTKF